MKLKFLTTLALSVLALFGMSTADAKVKLHTIGDSTMADYATDGSTDKRGWCQMLQQFFDSDFIQVNNRGKSGASSKSFYQESAYWPTLKRGGSDQMHEGDFLLIQFAHNDEKNGGADGDTVKAYYNHIGDAATASSTDYRGTTPYNTYRQYIRRYINEAKAMGVTPIVVGPICRKYFSGNTIRRNGQHDLGDSYTVCDGTTLTTGHKVPETNDLMDYVAAAREVAAEYPDVPFVDLTTLTAALYLSYGEAYCTSNLFCKDDNTHPQGEGATLIARTFAQQVKDQAASETDPAKKAVLQALADHVIVSSSISFNPTSGDMGKAYQGQQIVKEFAVSAFGLAAGTEMVISTEAPFQVSLDKKNFAQSVTIQSNSANIISNIYVRVNLTSAGTVTGTLTATAGSMTETLALSAQAISLTGGTETQAYWPLTSSTQPAESELLTVAEESFSELVVKNYAQVGGDNKLTMQRITTPDGSWPAGEIDEVSTRYVEFKATCPADYELAIDKISFKVTGAGGSAVSYHAYYALNSDFSGAVLFGEGLSIGTGDAKTVEKELAEQIGEGQSVYVRIYPWLNGLSAAATGKYLCLSDVTIHGMATKAGAQSVSYTGSISYPLVDSDPTFDPEVMSVGFTGKTVSYGSALTVSEHGGNTWSGSTCNGQAQTKVYNGSGASLPGSPNESNTITFTLTPDDGMVFLPSKVSLQAARYGTDGGTITAIVSGNGSSTICEGAAINRSGKGLELTTLSSEVSGVSADAEHPLKLAISVLGLGNTKSVGLNSIVIEGSLSGTLQETTKYSLVLNVSPEGAGIVSVYPELAAYKEGSQVTLKATANFGYKFAEWQEEGATFSAQPNPSLTMDRDRTLTAMFTPVPVYTVSTKATNDLELPLGSITLTPNDHEGRYEEGTEVTATAQESKILKFAGWTDEHMNHSVTSASRQLLVDQDMEIVAHYEIQDFIAVFDASKTQSYAYETTASYPFAADLTWDDNRNAHCCVVKVSDGSLVYSQSSGTPVVRNREGVVMAGINGLYQNGYRTSDIAWQYSFSTLNFTSATFTGDMAAKNMAHKNYKALWSADGVNFAEIAGATWEMTANVIKPISFQLPAEAMEKELIYIRITGTGTEMLSSAYQFDKSFGGLDYCDHSESGVGNVYILGEAVTVDDGKVPTVTSTLPVNGATGVSASGTVTISYSERIEKGNTSAKVLLGTKEVEPLFSSRSISFPYANLTYGESYTVSVPKGLVVDKSGNEAEAYSFTFQVMNRQKPAARTFDAIVDGSLLQLDLKEGKIAATDEMPAQYRSIQAAIDDAPANSTKPYLIFIKNGYYRDPNFTFSAGYGTAYTDRNPTATGTDTQRIDGGINEYDSCRIVYVNKPNIHLIGQDRDNVIIATDRFDGSCSDHSRVWYHISAGATVEVMAGGTDFYMEGVTVDNENWTKLHMAGPQALCFNIAGDRAVLNNVRARSYQDTYYNGGTYNRTFWNQSEIEGSVDFIYGASDVWFEGCTLNINRDKGGYIVAPNHPKETRWGYVFNNTRITTDDVSDPSKYSIWLGRPWHENPKTVFLHTQMELTPMDSLWYETMGGLPALWAVRDFHDKNGYALSEVSRKCYYYTENGQKVWGVAKNFLTDEEMAQYTIANVFSGDGSTTATGYWDPQPMVEKTATPQLSVNGNVITWEPDEYAICYVVTVNGKAVAFPTEGRYVANVGDVVTIQSVGENGQLSLASDPVTITTTDFRFESLDMPLDCQATYDLNGRLVPASAATQIRIEKGRKVMK